MSNFTLKGYFRLLKKPLMSHFFSFVPPVNSCLVVFVILTCIFALFMDNLYISQSVRIISLCLGLPDRADERDDVQRGRLRCLSFLAHSRLVVRSGACTVIRLGGGGQNRLFCWEG